MFPTNLKRKISPNSHENSLVSNNDVISKMQSLHPAVVLQPRVGVLFILYKCQERVSMASTQRIHSNSHLWKKKIETTKQKINWDERKAQFQVSFSLQNSLVSLISLLFQTFTQLSFNPLIFLVLSILFFSFLFLAFLLILSIQLKNSFPKFHFGFSYYPYRLHIILSFYFLFLLISHCFLFLISSHLLLILISS